MKKLLVVCIFFLSLGIFADGIEVLVLSTKGSVYVKKAGKRFAETIKLDTRYGEGTFIKTDEESYAELLLSDNSVISISENSSWEIGEDIDGIEARTKIEGSPLNLWDITLNALDKSNSSAAKSNIVGSIRVAGSEKPVQNILLNSTQKEELDKTLKAIVFSDPFARTRMIALTFESYGQINSAKIEFENCLKLTEEGSEYNQIIDFLVSMLQNADRPGMADAYLKLKK